MVAPVGSVTVPSNVPVKLACAESETAAIRGMKA
jgi:hypothetical protein